MGSVIKVNFKQHNLELEEPIGEYDEWEEYYKDYDLFMKEVNKESWSFVDGILKVKYLD